MIFFPVSAGRGMSLHIGLIIAFLMLVSAARPVNAEEQTEERHVAVLNLTGTDLYALYLAPAGTERWSEDLLRGNCLQEGKQVSITFPWRARALWWDLRVENKRGEAVIWKNVPVRRFFQLTLSFAGNSPRIQGK